jgi:hypothetical protein
VRSGSAGIEGGDAANGRPQAMNAAGIGRIADRSCDIGAMRDMPDAGRHGRPRAAGRTSGRNAGIARIFGVAVDQVGGEPAV